MNPYQSPEQAAAAEKSQAERAAIAARLGPQALWQPPDPVEVERKRAEQAAKQEAEEQAKRAKEVQHGRDGALRLREFAASTYLSAIAEPAFGDTVAPVSYQLYRTKLLADADVSGDPIGVMLVEHYMMLFHAAGKLLGLSCDLQQASAISAIGPVAVKYSAELRRMALAIEEYRSSRGSAAQKRDGKPSQQDEADRHDDVAPAQSAETKKKKGLHIELRSNGNDQGQRKANNMESTNGTQLNGQAQPAASCRRKTKPHATPRADGRGPRKAATGRA